LESFLVINNFEKNFTKVWTSSKKLNQTIYLSTLLHSSFGEIGLSFFEQIENVVGSVWQSGMPSQMIRVCFKTHFAFIEKEE